MKHVEIVHFQLYNTDKHTKHPTDLMTVQKCCQMITQSLKENNQKKSSWNLLNVGIMRVSITSHYQATEYLCSQKSPEYSVYRNCTTIQKVYSKAGSCIQIKVKYVFP